MISHQRDLVQRRCDLSRCPATSTRLAATSAGARTTSSSCPTRSARSRGCMPRSCSATVATPSSIAAAIRSRSTAGRSATGRRRSSSRATSCRSAATRCGSRRRRRGGGAGAADPFADFPGLGVDATGRADVRRRRPRRSRIRWQASALRPRSGGRPTRAAPPPTPRRLHRRRPPLAAFLRTGILSHPIRRRSRPEPGLRPLARPAGGRRRQQFRPRCRRPRRVLDPGVRPGRWWRRWWRRRIARCPVRPGRSSGGRNVDPLAGSALNQAAAQPNMAAHADPMKSLNSMTRGSATLPATPRPSCRRRSWCRR